MTNDPTQHDSNGDELQKAGSSAAAQDIEAMQAELERFKNLAARAQADLQNAKARAERESDELRKYATKDVFLGLLPILDNFNRAFKHLPDDIKNHEWVKGVAAIEKDLIKRLEEMGLVRFDSVGAKADPAVEEIVTVGPGEEGVVTEMLEDGYTLHKKVIRHAKVRVGDGSK